ncbi:MAG TPA: BTAD domain-containing putative transcriptional regulator [Rhizomicrobium sp.]|nr:BTAD domain-containing putative transcriptional regulator [Rhizomicrobium sp.]
MLQKVIGEPEFRVRCLGGLSLVEVRSGTDMTPAKRKLRALLAYLCIEQKPVGRERLATLLWGDRGDEQARASLRQTIYELRSPLGGDRLLRTEGDTVAIGERVSTDIEAIETAAQSGDLERLRAALSEWRGEILEDLSSIDAAFDTWLETARVHIAAMIIDAALRAAKAGMANGQIEQSRAIVNLLQERDSTNEMVLRLGLTLDHLAGDSASLHRRYERFRKLLKSELDAAPSAETQRLFRELDARSSGPVAEAAPGSGRIVPDPEGNHANSAAAFRERPAAGADAGKARSGHPTRRGSTIVAAVAASAIVLLAAFAWMVWNPLHKAPAPRPAPLLAVLPFQNLNADSGSRYFSDGITAEIVDAMLRITQIRVVSAGSSFRLRNSGAPAAAKALAATHILSGSIRRNGEQINVIAQLTDARNNQVIWSAAYDRTMTEIPALQHDIAVQIANALDMRLSPSALVVARNINPEAYDHYLRGRDFLFARNHDAAIAELETSIRLAPGFSRAWSSLAATRLVLAAMAVSPFSQDYDAAMATTTRDAAQRALTLDPNNGEALAVLAWVTPSSRLMEADRLLRRAVRAEPNNAELLNLYGEFLIYVGRRREAVNELARAYDVDRVIPSLASNLVEALLDTGGYEKADGIMALSRDNGLRNEFIRLHAVYFLYQQDWSGLAKFVSTLPQDIPPHMAAFFVLWRQTAVALATRDRGSFARLRASWKKQSRLDPDESALFLLNLGYPDDALDVIERAVTAMRKYDLLTDPEWDALFVPGLAPLRRDPRVPGLLAQWGLLDYWRNTNRWPDFCDEPTLPFDCKVEANKFMRSSGTHTIAKRS